MKFAVFASGGKQYKVNEGSIIEVEKLNVEAGNDVVFDSVLLVSEDGIVSVGQPTVFGVSISAKVLDQVKARKIRVAKFKAKARYRKVIGHRQQLTRIQIETIGKAAKKAETKATPAKESKEKTKK